MKQKNNRIQVASVGGNEKMPPFSVSRRERERNQRVLSQGAEAKIILSNNFVIKNRIKKSYRISEIDKKIRERRTRAETKLLTKASKIINCPIPENSEEKTKLKIPFIKGKKLSEHLDKLPLAKQKSILKQIGKDTAKLHKENIIHGDLTTSNMILIENNTPNFDKLLNELKQLKLPKKDYIIFGSGPLAIRGMRESGDIDILVNEKLFENLCKKYKLIDNKVIKIKDIEIYKDWPYIKNISGLIKDSEIIEGFPFAKLKHVIKWKKKNRRKKDKKDLELIKNYLSSKNQHKIYFIDFGLGYFNGKHEDKAVDIHLLKQALEAKHFKHWKELYKEFEKGYKSIDKTHAEKVLNQLIKVEKRGRYKK